MLESVIPNIRVGNKLTIKQLRVTASVTKPTPTINYNSIPSMSSDRDHATFPTPPIPASCLEQHVQPNIKTIILPILTHSTTSRLAFSYLPKSPPFPKLKLMRSIRFVKC